MAALEPLASGRRIPFDSDLKCPLCEKHILVEALVDVITGTAHKAGTAGFRKPIVTVHVTTKMRGISISHQCDYTEPERD